MRIDKSKITNFLIKILVLIGLTTCRNDTFEVIPDVSFNVYLSFNDLLTIGNGSAIAINNGGIKGLIIYKASEDEYHAYERLCTNYPADTAAVILDTQTMTATCPKCKSAFQLFLNGEVIKGQARYGLKEYATSLINGRLEIWN